MAATIKRAAGAAFKVGFKIDGESATEQKIAVTDLTQGVGPRLIDARASTDLVDVKIPYGAEGNITFTTNDYTFITWMNTGHNGCTGTLTFYSEFGGTDEAYLDPFHGVLTATQNFPMNGAVEMRCTFSPDTLSANLIDTTTMGYTSN